VRLTHARSRPPAARVVRWARSACRRQVVPLYAAIGTATFILGGFMYKYFGGHTDIVWDKQLRGDVDHQGKVESRVQAHNAHFGMRSLNKSYVSIFPFNFKPVEGAPPYHLPATTYPREIPHPQCSPSVQASSTSAGRRRRSRLLASAPKAGDSTVRRVPH